MTTSPVMGITDELVAELEALAGECGQHGTNWYEPRHMAAFPEYACDQDFVIAASPATILALLDEREELLRDAERLNWLSDQGDDAQWMNILRIEMDDYETLRDAIDEIMRQEG